jgi:hypothetical protein
MMISIEFQRALGLLTFWMLAIIRITDDGQNPNTYNPKMMMMMMMWT